jgi:hypothetical protein
MSTYYVKAWTVIGYTYEGSAYCLEHAWTEQDEYGLAPHPIFASDEYGDMSCDICHEKIEH